MGGRFFHTAFYTYDSLPGFPATTSAIAAQLNISESDKQQHFSTVL
ncbi:MAG: hypothetical protein F6J89_28115 [Symploca sp. SIO1C4]|uniref:Uncharacterized protein n=1 Tax=Symploca sp. SIO1C4 TaxID=2607765 RepID=A0A6B3NCU4_9CYAN|nr:hypothetical protein [Symploca sp. SIO1C4]